ncbi:hypothetical protein, partial [Oleiphilus sp. HI0132]|uniref:hypothetical protein n=1 Tax=Oleiphilus sp. HI0132 TaxID=1822270 RepID=UPI001E5EBD05
MGNYSIGILFRASFYLKNIAEPKLYNLVDIRGIKGGRADRKIIGCSGGAPEQLAALIQRLQGILLSLLRAC